LLLTHPLYVSTSYVKESVRKKAKDLIVDTKRSPKPLLDKIVNKLIKTNFITDTISFGETKFAVIFISLFLYKLFALNKLYFQRAFAV